MTSVPRLWIPSISTIPPLNAWEPVTYEREARCVYRSLSFGPPRLVLELYRKFVDCSKTGMSCGPTPTLGGPGQCVMAAPPLDFDQQSVRPDRVPRCLKNAERPEVVPVHGFRCGEFASMHVIALRLDMEIELVLLCGLPRQPQRTGRQLVVSISGPTRIRRVQRRALRLVVENARELIFARRVAARGEVPQLILLDRPAHKSVDGVEVFQSVHRRQTACAQIVVHIVALQAAVAEAA